MIVGKSRGDDMKKPAIEWVAMEDEYCSVGEWLLFYDGNNTQCMDDDDPWMWVDKLKPNGKWAIGANPKYTHWARFNKPESPI